MWAKIKEAKTAPKVFFCVAVVFLLVVIWAAFVL